jgi:hypothetical protein
MFILFYCRGLPLFITDVSYSMSTQAQFRLSHQNWCQKVMTSKSAEKFSADLAYFYCGDTLVSNWRTFEFNHGASC